METPFAAAQSMLEALRTKRISARELLAWHLERIVRYNPDLNAIVTFNEEQARQRAALADFRIAVLPPVPRLPSTERFLPLSTTWPHAYAALEHGWRRCSRRALTCGSTTKPMPSS